MDFTAIGYISIAVGLFMIVMGLRYFRGKSDNKNERRIEGTITKDHDATMKAFSNGGKTTKSQKIQDILNEFEEARAKGKNPGEPRFVTVEFSAGGHQCKEVIEALKDYKVGDKVLLSVDITNVADVKDASAVSVSSKMNGILFIIIGIGLIVASMFI